MQVSRREAAVLRKALAAWQAAQVLDEATAQALAQTIQAMAFDWKRLARYAFLVAILCILVAIATLLSDKYLMQLLARIFNAPHGVKCLGLSVLTAAIFGAGVAWKRKYPDKTISGEAIVFLGTLGVAGAVYQFGLALDMEQGHFSLLILLSCGIYALLAYRFRSGLIWLFALLSLGGWLGAETGYVSGWGAYYLGMNYPLRFTLFGGVLTAAALLPWQYASLRTFRQTTLVMGLLYLFIALWILSIFGNHGDLKTWQGVKQIELFHWSLLFALAAAGAIWHGLRFDNGTTKGFGVTFLLINLYTRFFEYFWNATHKIVFFLVLAASFWALGHFAEKLWNRETRSDAAEED